MNCNIEEQNLTEIEEHLSEIDNLDELYEDVKNTISQVKDPLFNEYFNMIMDSHKHSHIGHNSWISLRDSVNKAVNNVISSQEAEVLVKKEVESFVEFFNQGILGKTEHVKSFEFFQDFAEKSLNFTLIFGSTNSAVGPITFVHNFLGLSLSEIRNILKNKNLKSTSERIERDYLSIFMSNDVVGKMFKVISQENNNDLFGFESKIFESFMNLINKIMTIKTKHYQELIKQVFMQDYSKNFFKKLSIYLNNHISKLKFFESLYKNELMLPSYQSEDKEEFMLTNKTTGSSGTEK